MHASNAEPTKTIRQLTIPTLRPSHFKVKQNFHCIFIEFKSIVDLNRFQRITIISQSGKLIWIDSLAQAESKLWAAAIVYKIMNNLCTILTFNRNWMAWIWISGDFFINVLFEFLVPFVWLIRRRLLISFVVL